MDRLNVKMSTFKLLSFGTVCAEFLQYLLQSSISDIYRNSQVLCPRGGYIVHAKGSLKLILIVTMIVCDYGSLSNKNL